MNNNRNNNNNRRRGRGNNRQQGGGGNQNRIDSRSRGNAPQMLDKYKKLAQDAAHNGDRVQAEYYLQFADHYFRVIADNKARQDEARGGSRRDMADDDGDEGEDDFDAPRYNHRDNAPRDGGQRDAGQREGGRDRDGGNRNRDTRDTRENRDNRDNRRQRPADDQADEGQRAVEGDDAFEPADNPFTRPVRARAEGGDRDDAPRRQPRRKPRAEQGAERAPEPADDDSHAPFDAAALPPSIAAASSAAGDSDGEPAKKRAPRRRKAASEAGEDGEALKAVG